MGDCNEEPERKTYFRDLSYLCNLSRDCFLNQLHKYGGIQMTCIVNNCYRHERNPLTTFYQPQTQLKILARTVNYLIGEESGQ